MRMREIEAADLSVKKVPAKKKIRISKKRIAQAKANTDSRTKSKPKTNAKQRRADKQHLESLRDSSPDDLVETELDHNAAQVDELVERIPSLFEQESEQAQMYRSMFIKLRKMIEISEKKYLESSLSRDMYAALKGYAEMREIIADLRALADYTQQVNRVIDDIVMPLTQTCAASLIDYHKSILHYAQQNMDKNDYRLMENKLKNLAADCGVKIDEARVAAESVATGLFAPK